MLINSKERLETLFEAQNELEQRQHKTNFDDFYEEKLEQAWRRASAAPAYRDLGPYSREAFAALPLTPKQRLKDHPWDFTVAGVADSARYYETTGTTGKATPTPRLAEDVIWNAVSVATAWRRLLGPEDRVLSMLPSDIVPVGDLIADVCAHLGVPCTRAYPFAAGIADWDRLQTLWSTLRPTVVFLAPGVLLQATRLFKQRGAIAELREPVRSLMLLGEVSVPAMRARAGQWWGASVYDASYGSTETGTLAAACPGDRLHLLTAANRFELAVGHRVEAIAPGSSGNLVVTPLNLHARPLLRFDTGDEVAIGADCDCGDPAPTVAPLGRATDGLRLRGALLSPRAVEELVYRDTTATGYLIEADRVGERARLLLERDVDGDRDAEAAMAAALQASSRTRFGIEWDRVAFVNSLPSTTKSGGSQKSWKRSNVRTLEA